MYECNHARTSVRECECMCMHIRIHVRMNICMCMCLCLCVCMYVCICVRVCVCVHVWMCTFLSLCVASTGDLTRCTSVQQSSSSAPFPHIHTVALLDRHPQHPHNTTLLKATHARVAMNPQPTPAPVQPQASGVPTPHIHCTAQPPYHHCPHEDCHSF